MINCAFSRKDLERNTPFDAHKPDSLPGFVEGRPGLGREPPGMIVGLQEAAQAVELGQCFDRWAEAGLGFEVEVGRQAVGLEAERRTELAAGTLAVGHQELDRQVVELRDQGAAGNQQKGKRLVVGSRHRLARLLQKELEEQHMSHHHHSRHSKAKTQSVKQKWE